MNKIFAFKYVAFYSYHIIPLQFVDSYETNSWGYHKRYFAICQHIPPKVLVQ